METDLEHSIRLLQEIVEHMMESWFKGNYDSLNDLDYAIHEIINCSVGIEEWLPDNTVSGFGDIRNSLIIGTSEFELTEDEVKTLVFFWQDEYSDKLKKANERIKELEYCIKTMKTVK